MLQYIHPKPAVTRFILKDDGQFPNSGLYLLIYKGAIILPEKDDSSTLKKIFESNNWKNSWVNGILDYHHYHSNTHEVLGILQGQADVEFGGSKGVTKVVSKGDVIIIPAGVAHKCVKASDDFKCIGAYPDGMDYDLKKGEPSDRPKADENINKVKLPDTDPVYGLNGPIIINWEMQ